MIASQPETRRRFLRWSLRSLLLLFIPLCAVLAYYGYVYRQGQLATAAFFRMQDKAERVNDFETLAGRI